MSSKHPIMSDLDLLIALERHMPEIRTVHASLFTVRSVIATWTKTAVKKFDQAIEDGTPSMVASIDKFVLSSVTNKALDENVFDAEVDIFPVLSANKAMWYFHQLLKDVDNEYKLPYSRLSARAGGKALDVPLDHLHACFGAFTRAKQKLEDTLNKNTDYTVSVMGGKSDFTKLTASTINAFAYVTDARDAFMELQRAHQTVYELVKAR